jgi:hypothetical protein
MSSKDLGNPMVERTKGDVYEQVSSYYLQIPSLIQNLHTDVETGGASQFAPSDRRHSSNEAHRQNNRKMPFLGR